MPNPTELDLQRAEADQLAADFPELLTPEYFEELDPPCLGVIAHDFFGSPVLTAPLDAKVITLVPTTGRHRAPGDYRSLHYFQLIGSVAVALQALYRDGLNMASELH